jgi:hypothetical protein
MTTPPITLIGLAGRAGSGKDTAADYLCERYGFMRASFAAPIKSMLEALFEPMGVDHAYLHEPQLKGEPIAALGHLSARYAMQTLGTEWGRRLMGEDFWVHCLDAQLFLAPERVPVHDRIVVTDVRFPNETRWVRRCGGRTIRLQRHQAATAPAGTHESEAHADHLQADLLLVNNGPVAHLHDLLDGAMLTHGIDEREPLPQTF